MEILRAFRRSAAHEIDQSKRITIVQFGDYAEGYWRLKNGGAENYYAQKYAVDFVGSLVIRSDTESVAVVTFCRDYSDELLPNGVKTLGVELYPKGKASQHDRLITVVQKTRPSHLIVGFPGVPLISWALRKRIVVLPMFADSFREKGLRTKLKYLMLARLLNDPAIQFVANHNLSASMDLKRIGVNAEKILLMIGQL